MTSPAAAAPRSLRRKITDLVCSLWEWASILYALYWFAQWSHPYIVGAVVVAFCAASWGVKWRLRHYLRKAEASRDEAVRRREESQRNLDEARAELAFAEAGHAALMSGLADAVKHRITRLSSTVHLDGEAVVVTPARVRFEGFDAAGDRVFDVFRAGGAERELTLTFAEVGWESLRHLTDWSERDALVTVLTFGPKDDTPESVELTDGFTTLRFGPAT